MVLAATRPRVASAPLLSVEALTVRFDAFRALDAVDFEIGQGEAVALAGENGAGKSTLVRCIGGDIAPSSGRILVAGQRIGSNPAAAARSGVAVVWQDLALCNNLDVASNLLLGRERGRLLSSDTHSHGAARKLLESLGIPLRDTTRNVGSLSGGERQLLAIAKAMCGRPRLLILDEPTGALGINESAKVEQLATNVREQGTTVLLVSHASLFGGRGKMVHALLGGIVIATIYNGMGLLNFSAAVQFMVTALVLLAAVTVDALSRRGRVA
jgi:D-xylose transport system ATP-binding protein